MNGGRGNEQVGDALGLKHIGNYSAFPFLLIQPRNLEGNFVIPSATL